ncbi:hypothetical protein DFH27DRAFT_609689 [Peziza echinospora]|nr:hypothetical protein DFH27DRAFT_609689 [Peziza echinospora]
MLLKAQIEVLQEGLDAFNAIRNFRQGSMPMQRARLAQERGYRCLRLAKRHYETMEVAMMELNTNPDGKNSGSHSVIYGEARIQVRSWLASVKAAMRECTIFAEMALKEMEEGKKVGQGGSNAERSSSGNGDEESSSEDEDMLANTDADAVQKPGSGCDTLDNEDMDEEGGVRIEEDGK